MVYAGSIYRANLDLQSGGWTTPRLATLFPLSKFHANPSLAWFMLDDPPCCNSVAIYKQKKGRITTAQELCYYLIFRLIINSRAIAQTVTQTVMQITAAFDMWISILFCIIIIYH